jgi:hypothetical protein
MTDSQVPRAKMGIYRYFNIITQYFGQDNMRDAIPVPEEEEKHAYELPMRSHEGKTKLEKSWKQDPPMNSHQHTKLVLHGNQEKLYYWCRCHKSWTIHSPMECRKQHSERKKFKRNTDKPKNLNRQTVRGVENTTQKKPHSTPRTEQNESKARDDYHKWSKSNKDKSRKMETSECI